MFRQSRRFAPRFVSKLRVLLCSVAAAGVIGCLAVPAAQATSLTAWPTFECYTGGQITADKITVNEDGKTTRWFPEVYEWNGKAWVIDAVPSQLNTFYDGLSGEISFGYLGSTSFNFTVARGHYYEVKDEMGSTGDAGMQYAWDYAMVGHVSTYECYVG